MSERSIGSWRQRFREPRAFQQTEVGLRRVFRAMHKVLSQMLDGDLGDAGPRRRAVRGATRAAKGEQKQAGS